MKSGRQKGDQEALQGVDDHVRRMLCAGAEMEYRKNLRERIDGQPEPDHLCGAAQPGSQLIQLEMWEPEVAEGALVQGLCVLASASQPGGDGVLPVAEDALCSGRIQPFGERRQHHRDLERSLFLIIITGTTLVPAGIKAALSVVFLLRTCPRFFSL